MRYWTHLVTLDPSGTRVLVRRSRAGWLLPYFSPETRGRVGGDVLKMLAQCGLKAVLIHEAFVAGESAEKSFHWYALSQATNELPVEGELQFMPVEALTPGSAVLTVQNRALHLAMTRCTNPVATFDSREGVDRVHHWVADRVAAAGRSITGPPISFRFQRYIGVFAYPTESSAVYYKGGSPAIDAEARLTQALHDLAPEHFADTLGYEPDGHWLQESVAGRFVLPQDLTDSHAAAIGRTLASIQQQAQSSVAVREALRGRGIDEARLVQAVGRIARLVEQQHPEEIEGLTSFPEQIEETVRLSYRRLAALDLPETWIHSDLWFPNVKFDGDTVTFIDLENGFWGPALLPLWRLSATFAEHSPTGAELSDAATTAFLESWSDALPPVRLRAALSELPLVGRAFYQLLLIERLERHVIEDERDDIAPPSALLKVSKELYEMATEPLRIYLMNRPDPRCGCSQL